MTVLFDATWIYPGCKGVGNYCEHLLAAVARYLSADNCELHVIIRPSLRNQIHFGDAIRVHEVTVHSELWWQLIGVGAIIWRVRPRVFHSPVGCLPLVPLPHRTKCILTFHESYSVRDRLGAQRFDKSAIARRLLEHASCLSLYRAARVIAISKFIKISLINLYNVPEHKIQVIYEAPCTELSGDRVTNEKYIFAIVSGDDREDWPAIFRGFDLASKQLGPACPKLVLCGVPKSLRNRVLSFIRDENIRGDVCLETWLPPAEFVARFSNAQFYIDMSRYEGFGLQVVESLMLGVPVICSDIPAHRETGGDACLYVPAGDWKALGETVSYLAASDAERSRLRIAGERRASLFSWCNAAIETIQLYKEESCAS